MGTRADFYIGRGPNAEWLGSIAWDGYDIPEKVSSAKSDGAFREAVSEMLAKRDDGTAPEDGWPWPWDDSRTTDYAYAFDGEGVWVSSFGRSWCSFKQVAAWRKAYKAWQDSDEADEADEPVSPCDGSPKDATFPNMADRKDVTFGARSGLMVVRAK